MRARIINYFLNFRKLFPLNWIIQNTIRCYFFKFIFLILDFSMLSFFYETTKECSLDTEFLCAFLMRVIDKLLKRAFSKAFLIFPNTTLTAHNTENYLYWKLINFLTFFHNHFLLRSLFNWIAITGNSDKQFTFHT